MYIRTSRPEDYEPLVAIWLRAVRATHHFLNEDEIQLLLPSVQSYLMRPGHDLWVVCEGAIPVGFMGLDGSTVQSLFIDPDRFNRGAGRALLAHARIRAGASLAVDVNEQNPNAIAFYRAAGFEAVGRSPFDDEGRPYPVIHMHQREPSGSGA